MIQKISETTGGKVGLGVVVLAALGIAAYAISASSSMSGGGYGKQVSVKDAAASAQIAIDKIKGNTKIPEAVRQQEIAHLQAKSMRGTVILPPPPNRPPQAGDSFFNVAGLNPAFTQSRAS